MGVLNDIPFLTNHNGATRGVLIGSDVRTQKNAVRKTKTLNGYILVNFNSNWTNDPSFLNFFLSQSQPWCSEVIHKSVFIDFFNSHYVHNNLATKDQYILALVHLTCNVFLFDGDSEYYFLFDVKKENITCNIDFIWRQIFYFSLIWRRKRKYFK